MSRRSRTWLRYTLVGVWALFTISLVAWWYVYTVQTLHELLHSQGQSEEASRLLRMFTGEGIVLLVSLLGAGFSLAYFVFRDIRQNQRLREFFLTFTHEIKTPLTSLRLQAESLQEDLSGSSHLPLVERLVADTNRLAIQIENSLLLAESDRGQLLKEELDLGAFIESLRLHWPSLRIELHGNASLSVDSRACECILRNLFQNAISHGRAAAVTVRVEPADPGMVSISMRDNGRGLQGEAASLGKLFGRTYAGSGNGVGLYLVQRLAKRMGGSASFDPTPPGFGVQLVFPGRCL